MSDTIFTATQGGRDKKWGGGGLEGEMWSLGFLKDRGYKVMSVCHGHDVAAEAEARTGLQDEQAGTEMQSASGVGVGLPEGRSRDTCIWGGGHGAHGTHMAGWEPELGTMRARPTISFFYEV